MANSVFDKVYNPDVLSCLANLSNDEVFTPPEIVNQMLDLLPQELFKNPDTKFLDPACKTGVFLREIAKRLIKGLEPQFPDLQQRIDHIFHNQLYGIAITELTSLLSRRGLYCSKYPNSEFSVSFFDTAEGNIRYKKVSHTWKDGRCIYCGASQKEYDRDQELETHAYEFIHTLTPEEIFNMKFDVIISNPPYQFSTAGDDNGAQATPIYQKFVTQAIKLSSNYLIMITPSRWFTGGWGLDEFRNLMINCNHIKEIHDFQNSSDCFNGVEIKGGVSYFLYDKNYNGLCDFYSHDSNQIISKSRRYLHEKGCEVLIRYNELIDVYRKVTTAQNFKSFSKIVSGRSPFGFNTNHTGNDKKASKDDVQYFERKGLTYMPLKLINKGVEFIDKHKLFIAKASEDGKLPGKVIGNITEGLPGIICSGTYLMIGPFNNYTEMTNCKIYMQTKFFRALVAVNKISQNASYKVYEAVPLLDFSKPWTDEELYAKYNLSQEEIDFIESMIKPME